MPKKTPTRKARKQTDLELQVDLPHLDEAAPDSLLTLYKARAAQRCIDSLVCVMNGGNVGGAIMSAYRHEVADAEILFERTIRYGTKRGADSAMAHVIKDSGKDLWHAHKRKVEMKEYLKSEYGTDAERAIKKLKLLNEFCSIKNQNTAQSDEQVLKKLGKKMRARGKEGGTSPRQLRRRLGLIFRRNKLRKKV